jgi:dipeptidyl aminopeptidase/acylaminoacyl peptidase
LAATTSAVSYVLADRAGCATLVEHDLGTGERREVRHGGTAPACAPPHRECDLVETDEGHRVPVYLYRRTGSAPRAWILDLHGGPTEQARYSLEPSLARLVDAGIGVVAVDYVGSSGHGRDYRSALYGRWGTAEVANCLAVAEWLIGTHGADPRRICVRGGSAGGWTALRALARSDRMCGAIVWSPVVDVAAMVHSPHDFEAAYMGRLFGEPGARTVREGDLEWAQHISAPVLLIHGADDTIVPVRQTLRLAEVLRARGALFECVVIEGEGHLIRRESSLRCIEEAEDRFVSKVFG